MIRPIVSILGVGIQRILANHAVMTFWLTVTRGTTFCHGRRRKQIVCTAAGDESRIHFHFQFADDTGINYDRVELERTETILRF